MDSRVVGSRAYRTAARAVIQPPQPPAGYESIGDICVNPRLLSFVNERVLPGTGIEAARFWAGLDDIVGELGPRNKALLQKRDELQVQIDAYLRGEQDMELDQCSFLERIGYLVPNLPDAAIVTQGVDAEIATIAGPQLVCPVDNARFIINAANARWGSLLDALYGTNAMVPGSSQGPYDTKRGSAVFDAAHQLLDELFPLRESSWGEVTALTHKKGVLKATVGPHEVSLEDTSQLVGFTAATDGSSTLSLLLQRNGLHCEIVVDRSGGAREHAAGIVDIRLESALSTICDFEDSACTVDTEVSFGALPVPVLTPSGSRLDGAKT